MELFLVDSGISFSSQSHSQPATAVGCRPRCHRLCYTICVRVCAWVLYAVMQKIKRNSRSFDLIEMKGECVHIVFMGRRREEHRARNDFPKSERWILTSGSYSEHIHSQLMCAFSLEFDSHENILAPIWSGRYAHRHRRLCALRRVAEQLTGHYGNAIWLSPATTSVLCRYMHKYTFQSISRLCMPGVLFSSCCSLSIGFSRIRYVFTGNHFRIRQITPTVHTHVRARAHRWTWDWVRNEHKN